MLGDGVARFAAQDVFEARLSAALIVQAHEINLGIIDAPAREGIDVDVSLVPGRNSHGQSIPFQEALIDAVNLLDEGQLEMQAGFGDWIALRFPKLSYNHLFNLVDGIEGAEQSAQNQQTQGDHDYPETAALVHLVTSGLLVSGRIGSNCRIESSMMILGPIAGRTSPIVSR